MPLISLERARPDWTEQSFSFTKGKLRNGETLPLQLKNSSDAWYQHILCIHFYKSHSPGTVRHTQSIRTLCVLRCFWCAYCSVAFFVPRPRYRRKPDSLISPFPPYNFLKTWHFFLLQRSFLFLFLLLSKDKLWKTPKMNNEKNPFLWILLSSGDQSHLLIKVI